MVSEKIRERRHAAPFTSALYIERETRHISGKVAPSEDDERRLRIELLQAEIENKRADTDNKWMDTEYKRGLLRYEPWKVVVAGFAAGGIIFGAVFGALGYKLGQTPPPPPQPIIIQVPAPAPAPAAK